MAPAPHRNRELTGPITGKFLRLRAPNRELTGANRRPRFGDAAGCIDSNGVDPFRPMPTMRPVPKETIQRRDKVPASIRDPGAGRFWIAVVLTGVAAGIGAALLTALLKEVQGLAWGAYEPSALTEAARRASAVRHVLSPHRRRRPDRRGPVAAHPPCERQRHRHHHGDLVPGRAAADAPHARQRGPVDRHRRHGRAARPRRRAEAGGRGVRQSLVELAKAFRRAAASDGGDRRRAPAWPPSTASRSGAPCSPSRSCAGRWRFGWSCRRSPPRPSQRSSPWRSFPTPRSTPFRRST